MPSSFSSVQVHLVFSTKDRRPFLNDLSLRAEAHRYIGGISKKLDCQPLIVGGVADHVHILAEVGRSVALADWTKEVKRVSSGWLKGRIPEFSWQGGYGAFSVDRSSVAQVRAYIERQEEHHRVRSFQDEFRELLTEHGITWDERYIWG